MEVNQAAQVETEKAMLMEKWHSFSLAPAKVIYARDGDDVVEEENVVIEDDVSDDNETINPLECVVYLSGERCFAFMPYGHLCACATCVKVLLLCPVCRSCNNRRKIFLN